MNFGQSLFQLGYELSPVILQNGLANNLPGSVLPIVALTEAANSAFTILNFQNPIDPNNFFAHFRPLPGGTLMDNEVAMYPFANQTYAANAVIAKPLKISLLMNCPANINGGYVAKQITFSALQAALQSHVQMGGTFIVATPSYIYQNCILTNLSDVSRPDSQQPQNAWQMDFIQPLLSEQPKNTMNSLMGALQAGIQSSGLWSGVTAVLNNSAPVASPLAGANNVLGSNSINSIGVA